MICEQCHYVWRKSEMCCQYGVITSYANTIYFIVVDSLEGYIFLASNNEPEVAQLHEKILLFADSTYNFKH